MSLLSEVREDMRLARLNNPGYRGLFRLLDVVIGLFKLVVLAAFGLGIWHIIYGINVADSKRNLSQFADALKSQNVASIEADADTGELTPERIEMLRQFARANRDSGDSLAPTDIVAGNTATDAVIISPVVSAEAIVDESVAASQLAAVTQNEPSLDLESEGVFEALEKKLLPAASRGNAPIAALPPVPAAVTEPLSPEQILADTSVVEQAPENTATRSEPVLAKTPEVEPARVPAASGGELNDETWLLAQSSDQYVIQIGSTTNRPFLVRFARLLPDDQPKAVFHYIFNKKPEYGLSFGLYDSKAQANAALEQLSQKARRYGAFARKISIIQKQIDELADKVALAQ